ncbi:MAG: toprim domain-containing protein [Desulfobacterales bacterium]|nr:toprim domain-containing protein [Desulfobacterales bacterium]
MPVYRFMWEGEETCVMGLRGHIIELDFPKGMSSWEGTDPRSLIDARPVKNVSEHSIATKLKELSGEASSILVATDFDREGELIGSEAVEMALGDLEDKRVFRARFSSLTPDEVRSSFKKLTRLDLALANAAETRQVIDLVWGATLTRFISLASGRLGHAFLSVGRVTKPDHSPSGGQGEGYQGFRTGPILEGRGEVRKGRHNLRRDTHRWRYSR